jgi:O-antigen ligase
LDRVTDSGGDRDRDPLGCVLEFGLTAVLIIAPMPFGSVPPAARLALEIAAFLLVLVWIFRAATRGAHLPPRAVGIGIAGILCLALLQALPLPSPVLRSVAPRAEQIRHETEPPPALRSSEAALLGVDPSRFGTPGTFSVDRGSTASALRTGAALAGLLLVATTVAATRGVRRLALALLVSAAFQGLYGLLVLVSGHDRIWHLPKRYGLDAATGTFVNRNHFACLLAMSLACGMALILYNAKRERPRGSRNRLVELLSPAGSRNLLLGVLLVVGLAGLLTSFSRAGIAVGLFALTLTIVAAGRSHGLRTRLIITTLIIAAAVLPLAQVGYDRLVGRYEQTAEDLQFEGGRATVWLDTVRMASVFPLFGTGYGTFAEIYPLFRSPEVRKFYQFAHNDPLQALAEGGVAGLVFLGLLAIPIVLTVVAGIRGAKGVLGVGFAAGLAAMLLHSLVDFNFHIPANAATAAILAGALLGLPWSDRT